MIRFGNNVPRLARSSISGVIILAMITPLPVAAELEEIVVTARKREVSLQDAAIAVSVTSGEDFDKSNVVKLDNFNGFAPGLVVAKNDGAGRVIAIRGVGWETAQNIASQPSVLTYIDGVYLANPLSAGIDPGEMERIEVYRGPQGTEFGQGTTGGAVNLVTRKPELDDFNGYGEVSYGTYNTTRARGAMNMPFSDTAAMRAYIQKYDRDGILGQLFYQDSDQHAAAQKNVDDPNADARELTQDFPGIFKLENLSASLTITWETMFGVTIKSLTGYQRLKKRQSVDGDRLTEATISRDIHGFGVANNWDVLPFWDNDSDALSQEINAAYSGEQLDWVFGFYYLNHDNLNDFLEATAEAPFSASAAALANPSAVTLPPFNSALLFNETREVQRDDKALYGQAAYRLNDMFTLTGGLRYQTEEQRDFGNQFFGIFGGFDRLTEDSQVTWKAGLDVNLTGDNLVYALVSTGWKNGGTNPGAVTNGARFLGETFAAEEVRAYEIGTRNTLFNNTVRFNLTAFYYDHENLQFIFEDPVPFGGGTGALPEVEEYGVETEFSWQVTEAWRLDGMFAWQDGKIKGDLFALDVVDFREALAPGVGLFTPGGRAAREALATSTNLKGNEPPKLPDLLARLSLSHNHGFAGGSVFASRIEYVHRGKMQARVFNNPLVDGVPSYNIVNLNFNYTLAGYPVSVNLSVTNLFDEDGINNTFTNPFGLWTTSNEYIPPREVIGSIRYNWN